MFLLTSEYLHTHAVQSLDGCVFFSLVFCLWSAVMLSHRLPGVRHRSVVCDAGGGPAPPPLPPLFAQRGGVAVFWEGLCRGVSVFWFHPARGVAVFWEGLCRGPSDQAVFLGTGQRPTAESPVAVGPEQSALPVSLEGWLRSGPPSRPWCRSPSSLRPRRSAALTTVSAPPHLACSRHGAEPRRVWVLRLGVLWSAARPPCGPGVNGVTFPDLFSRLDSGASGSDRSAGLGAD